jgi:hypothetical protein
MCKIGEIVFGRIGARPRKEQLFNWVGRRRNQATYDPSSYLFNYWSGANPTIASYNASVEKIYNATNSMARFYNNNYFSLT